MMEMLGIAFFMILVKLFEICIWFLGITLKVSIYIMVLPFVVAWKLIKGICGLIIRR